jgi:hypothetical protein
MVTMPVNPGWSIYGKKISNMLLLLVASVVYLYGWIDEFLELEPQPVDYKPPPTQDWERIRSLV